MANLRLQRRIAASVLKCGQNRVWLDPNQATDIAAVLTRKSMKNFIKDGLIRKKKIQVHSRFRALKRYIENSKGRHSGKGKRLGSANARTNVKTLWMKRQRILRRLLRRYRKQRKIDKKLYHKFYYLAKGNQFKNKKVLIETIQKEKTENQREKKLEEEQEKRRHLNLEKRKRKLERRTQKLQEHQNN